MYYLFALASKSTVREINMWPNFILQDVTIQFVYLRSTEDVTRGLEKSGVSESTGSLRLFVTFS